MNKQEFLTAIREKLPQLPPRDLERSLEFYAEAIDDRMEDGLTEEQAVEAVGPAEEAAAQILAEVQPPASPAVRSSRRLRVWEIVLLVLGAPLWMMLLMAAAMVLLAAAAVVLTCYLLLWTGVVTLYAADLVLAAGAVSGLAGFGVYLAAGKPGPALVFLGLALVCGGLTVPVFFGCNQAAKGVLWLGNQGVCRIKSLSTRKGKK